MAIVFPDVGRELLLNLILASAQEPKIHLFTNDVDLDNDTVLADLEEADFTGYAAVTPAVVLVDINGTGQGHADLAEIVFTCTADGDPQNIRGWYMTIIVPGFVGMSLLLAEKFSPYLVVENDEDEVRFELDLLDELAD